MPLAERPVYSCARRHSGGGDPDAMIIVPSDMPAGEHVIPGASKRL